VVTATSGLWTDPKTAGYVSGELWPYLDANDYLDAVDVDDIGLLRTALTNMSKVDSLSFATPIDTTVDEERGSVIVVGALGGAAIVNIIGDQQNALSATSIAGAMTAARCVSYHGGVLLAGGSPAGATSSKILRSVDGGDNWTLRSLGISDANDVVGLAFFSTWHVATVGSGSAAATIHTSVDGITWSPRTNPLSNTTWRSSRNGGLATSSDLIIAVPSTQGQLAISGDAQTWELITTPPVSLFGAAHTDEHGWMAVHSAGLITSPTGRTWIAPDRLALPTGVSSVYSFASVGGTYLLSWDDGEDVRLSASYDGCRTWETRVVWRTEDEVGISVSDGRVVATHGSEKHVSIMTGVL
jgi:hypothetical protein